MLGHCHLSIVDHILDFFLPLPPLELLAELPLDRSVRPGYLVDGVEQSYLGVVKLIKEVPPHLNAQVFVEP